MTLPNALKNSGILSPQEAEELNSLLLRRGINNQDALPILRQFFDQKFMARSTPEGQSMVIFSISSDAVQKEVEAPLLDVLYSEGVIEKQVHDRIRELLSKANEFNNLYILSASSELTKYYKSFTMESQLEFAILLRGNDMAGRDAMLSVEEYKSLSAEIKANKIDSYLDILKRCYCCRAVDLSGSPDEWLNRYKQVLNDLIYSTFYIVDISYRDEGLPEMVAYGNRKGILSISTGVKEYQHEFIVYDTDRNLQGNVNPILENLLDAVNHILAGFNCNYRFTGVFNRRNHLLSPNSSNDYVVCRYTQQQLPIFDVQAMEGRLLLNRPHVDGNFRLPMSYAHIEYAIYHVRECGLLAHLSEDQIEDSLGRFYEDTYTEVGDLLTIFPDTIAEVRGEVGSAEQPNRDFLLALNRISHGLLHFEDIVDGIPQNIDYGTEEDYQVSFTCNGKSHRLECNQISREFGQEIVYYVIREIILKTLPDHELISLYNWRVNVETFLFATKAQGNYLKERNLKHTNGRFDF